MDDDCVERGQIWVCNSIDDLPPLLSFVGRIDPPSPPDHLSNIVSVFVSPHPQARENGWPKISHMPIIEECFRQSELRLFRSDAEVPDAFERGYAIWKSKFDIHQAGVFSITLSEAYGSIAEALRNSTAN